MTKLAYQAHQLKREQLKPLNDSVIVGEMVFDQRITTGGIVLLNDNGKSTGIRPRWGQVFAVGPTQHVVKVGQWILVEHGRWSRGLKIQKDHEEFVIRRADPTAIIFVSDEQPDNDETISTAVPAERKSL